jgi:ubiquinone/menaquinone biosynthesis C-methylase UbiE
MTSNNHSRKSLFDRWSTHYDDDVDVGQFPLIGYGDVLQAVIRLAALDDRHQILDLGVGTGNLSKLFPVSGNQIWGADFSIKMLERARSVLP